MNRALAVSLRYLSKLRVYEGKNLQKGEHDIGVAECDWHMYWRKDLKVGRLGIIFKTGAVLFVFLSLVQDTPELLK